MTNNSIPMWPHDATSEQQKCNSFEDLRCKSGRFATYHRAKFNIIAKTCDDVTLNRTLNDPENLTKTTTTSSTLAAMDDEIGSLPSLKLQQQQKHQQLQQQQVSVISSSSSSSTHLNLNVSEFASESKFRRIKKKKERFKSDKERQKEQNLPGWKPNNNNIKFKSITSTKSGLLELKLLPKASSTASSSSPSSIVSSKSLTCPSVVILALVVVISMSTMIASGLIHSHHSRSSPGGQQVIQVDPRPTIYSGQVSFGLLLSAHSSHGAEMSTSASQQVSSILSLSRAAPNVSSWSSAPEVDPRVATSGHNHSEGNDDEDDESAIESPQQRSAASGDKGHRKRRIRRQIFEHQKSQTGRRFNGNGNGIGNANVNPSSLAGELTTLGPNSASSSSATPTATTTTMPSECSQVNMNALYAGMGAIWASHQANLIGDNQFSIGAYVYDSCNDLEVGQRQSVRIVSNLNAFQQTTCESPRGSPISLTIAHGDNQLRAIQLLTSFRVPVVSTREFFALEDYALLSADQRRFLFATAPSSRHLALGALKFAKTLVGRLVGSAKLPNQHHRNSPKNGLVVISRNLPVEFVAHLNKLVPAEVNYEMLLTREPIDPIKSIESLEAVLTKGPSSSSSASDTGSESRPPTVRVPATATATATVEGIGGAADGHTQRTRNTRATHRTTSSLSGATGSAPNLDDQDGDGEGEGSMTAESLDYDTTSGGDTNEGGYPRHPGKMLSPAIVMFITPSEAIDLITRLRNDLAEVSKYYALVVVTREDITPALKTIFHRGGSHLCSGKAFYTISPKPDEIGEFSRYFHDTVQYEGVMSDHPLICDFAKHKSSSRASAADLDDVSAEAVIKAVWAAAAAFKVVHNRECGHLLQNGAPEGAGGQSQSSSTSAPSSATSGSTGASGSNTMSEQQTPRQLKGRQSGKSAHSECMIKMSKNMSQLVQRALRMLDVTINSTGLPSLDGSRLKFDDNNELASNKFSIRHISKECEIEEVGRFTGFKHSLPMSDDNNKNFDRSLLSTLPDAWPVTARPTTQKPKLEASTSALPSSSTSSSSPSSLNADSSGGSSPADQGDSGGQSNESAPPQLSNRRKKSEPPPDADQTSDGGGSDGAPGEDESASGGPSDSATSSFAPADSPPPKKSTTKRSRPGDFSPGFGYPQTPTQTTMTTSGIMNNNPTTATARRRLMTQQTIQDRRPQQTTTTQPVANTEPYSSIQSQTRIMSTEAPVRMRKLKPFPTTAGTSISDWLPSSNHSPSAMDSSGAPEVPNHLLGSDPLSDAVRGLNLRASLDTLFALSKPLDPRAQQHQPTVTPDTSKGTNSSTTAAPPQRFNYTTPPESGGNADLELPAKKSSSPGKVVADMMDALSSKTMDTAATTTSETIVPADYVTLPTNAVTLQPFGMPGFAFDMGAGSTSNANQTTKYGKLSMMSSDSIDATPIPLMSSDERADGHNHHAHPSILSETSATMSTRIKLRSHLIWIYNSWSAMAILVANVCGALITLYVLTFLLKRNCDGSLVKENQGLRSIHLLAIIVVFFGSTLFIVSPTPGLCLLRTSWHNFGLVMLFGSLLLQTMQIRSLSSLGLGGRPNRLNQFLTLMFMVGVQVSFELQRWKYESANYVNFVNQYFGSPESDYKRLMILGNSIASQFNPLNSFSDFITPVSIRLSEKYQGLLQDYCLKQSDDFMQSQIYLCLLVSLLLIFSTLTRNSRKHYHGSSSNNSQLLLSNSMSTSGKLVASEHEANLPMAPSDFRFASSTTTAGSCLQVGSDADSARIFVVTIVNTLIYMASIMLQSTYSQSGLDRDLTSSVSMVLIAFVTLIGLFLPVVRQMQRFESVITTNGPSSASSNTTSLTVRPLKGVNNMAFGLNSGHHRDTTSPSSSAFVMYPEFAPSGAANGGDSSLGGATSASRRAFAETKESRRQMGFTLANLGPSIDLDPVEIQQHRQQQQTLAELKSRVARRQSEELPASQARPANFKRSSNQIGMHPTTGEKRLIMLDVDPCCPRHGHVVRNHQQQQQPSGNRNPSEPPKSPPRAPKTNH